MANDRIYIVDWNKLPTWHIPGLLRKGKLLAFVKAIITPINDLHSRFLTFRTGILYRLSITPQVCYMEKALNDRYDVELRRIRIVDAAQKLPVILFTKPENKPKKLYTKVEAQHLVLYTKGETAQFTVDFIVRVPVFVDFDLTEMTAVINSYKLLSKTFKIMIF